MTVKKKTKKQAKKKETEVWLVFALDCMNFYSQENSEEDALLVAKDAAMDSQEDYIIIKVSQSSIIAYESEPTIIVTPMPLDKFDV